MVVVRSSTTVRSIPSGIEAWRNGSCARIRSTVAMMLAPGWRKTMIGIARLPFRYPATRDVLHRVGDLRDVREAHRRAVAVADDQGRVVVGVRDLVVGEDVRRDVSVRELALGEVGVLQAQDGLQIGQREPVAGELRWDRVDAHRRAARRRRR